MGLMRRGTRLQFLAAAMLLFYGCTAISGQSRSSSYHPLLVGYFPASALTIAQPFYVKTLVSNGAAGRLDQIDYSQVSGGEGRAKLCEDVAFLHVLFTRQNSVNLKTNGATAQIRGYFHQLV